MNIGLSIRRPQAKAWMRFAKFEHQVAQVRTAAPPLTPPRYPARQ